MDPDTGARDGAEQEVSAGRRATRTAGAVAGAGLQFAIAILLFLYAGQWVDRRLGSSPWGVLVGVFLGAVAGFTSIYRKLMADLERQERAKKR
jgi:F0F1-type ATP synthase assembly protein I